jgi:FlaA1/EpsC-like NDP-sugar epimerase
VTVKSRLYFLLAIDAILVNIAYLLAYYLRFAETGRFQEAYLSSINVIFFASVIHIAAFYIGKLYHRIWAYASIGELLAVFYSVSSGTLGLIAISFFFRESLSRSIIIIAWALIILFIGGSRFFWRLYMQEMRSPLKKKTPRHRVLIIGAGDAGAMVARELLSNDEMELKPAGFIDDDPLKRNSSLLGIPVLGTTEEIPEITKQYQIKEIIIAMPSVKGEKIKNIVELCHKTGAKLKILPGIYEIINGRVSVDRIRPVQVEDLLGREPVKVDMTSIASYLQKQVVLVTGAGGSIGSELCRQAASFNPHRLVILGHGENSIHKIWRELSVSFPQLDIAVEIADIRDRRRIEQVFKKHKPNVVFHAAAHKHVPLMEMHPGEALKTNVFGTRNVAEAAHHYSTKVFIMISTDKAVNPSSVMGASKRLAELIIRRYDRRSSTIYAAVRFGNVLGSNGSVVPVFEQQIRNGGPVTVTHPDMERYFMTIPEAVTLVIQAGAIAVGGEVFILDMGNPVRILDLAKDMIKLSGYVPDEDIKIVYTGIRPGEKLFEELLTKSEGATATRHDKIFVAHPAQVETAKLEKELEAMEGLELDIDGDRVFEVLKRIDPGFRYHNENTEVEGEKYLGA